MTTYASSYACITNTMHLQVAANWGSGQRHWTPPLLPLAQALYTQPSLRREKPNDPCSRFLLVISFLVLLSSIISSLALLCFYLTGKASVRDSQGPQWTDPGLRLRAQEALTRTDATPLRFPWRPWPASGSEPRVTSPSATRCEISSGLLGRAGSCGPRPRIAVSTRSL